MGGCGDGWMDGWVGAVMDGWMDGWVGAVMDGWMALFILIAALGV